MKVTRRQLIRIIEAEMKAAGNIYGAATPSEIEAVVDAWAGGENVVSDIDQSKAAGSEPVTRGQEIMKITESPRDQITEKQVESMINEELNARYNRSLNFKHSR